MKMFSLTAWNQFHCISKGSNLPSLHCFIPWLWQNPVTNFMFSQRSNVEKQPADLHLLIRIKLQLSRDHRLHHQLQPTLLSRAIRRPGPNEEKQQHWRNCKKTRFPLLPQQTGVTLDRKTVSENHFFLNSNFIPFYIQFFQRNFGLLNLQVKL